MKDFVQADDAALATISLAKLASPDPHKRNEEVERVRDCCETVGFFYLSDHGLHPSLVARIFKAARTFFGLPLSVKEESSSEKQVYVPNKLRGYHSFGDEQLNPGQEFDQKQSFDLGPNRPHIPGVAFTGPTIGPSDAVAPDFMKSQYELLEHAMTEIIPVLARAFALALGVKENFFLDNVGYDEVLITQRVLHYPPRKGSTGRHSDSGLFTILLQETQHGPQSSLKLYSQERWRNVQARDDLLVVNLANMIHLWSGGRFVSTPHQVINVQDKDRVSVPIFVYPKADARIKPINGSDDDVLIAGEMHKHDIENIWKRNKGAGNWGVRDPEKIKQWRY